MGKTDDWLKEPGKKRERVTDWLKDGSRSRKGSAFDWLKGPPKKPRFWHSSWLHWSGPGPEPDTPEWQARKNRYRMRLGWLLSIVIVAFVVLFLQRVSSHSEPKQAALEALVGAVLTGGVLYTVYWLLGLLYETLLWARRHKVMSLTAGALLVGGGWMGSSVVPGGAPPWEPPPSVPRDSGLVDAGAFGAAEEMTAFAPERPTSAEPYLLRPFPSPRLLPPGYPPSERQKLENAGRSFNACVKALVPEPLDRERKRLIYRKRLSPEDAEDVTMKALQKICVYHVKKGVRELPPFFVKAVERMAIDFRRDPWNSRRCPISSPDPWSDEDALLKGERDDLLKAAICTLSEKHQNVVRLRYEGEEFVDIAARLGMRKSQAEDAYYNSIPKMKSYIEAQYAESVEY